MREAGWRKGVLGRDQLTQACSWWLPGEFVISPVEGVLRVRKDVELDRETIAFYNLTICARDRGVPPLSSTVSLAQLCGIPCGIP